MCKVKFISLLSHLKNFKQKYENSNQNSFVLFEMKEIRNEIWGKLKKSFLKWLRVFFRLVKGMGVDEDDDDEKEVLKKRRQGKRKIKKKEKKTKKERIFFDSET